MQISRARERERNPPDRENNLPDRERKIKTKQKQREDKTRNTKEKESKRKILEPRGNAQQWIMLCVFSRRKNEPLCHMIIVT